RNFSQLMWPWASAKVQVKVQGLPARSVAVFPWYRTLGPTTLQIPGAFLRPVVLVGGEGSVILSADKQKHRVRVCVDDKLVADVEYDGRAVLVGATDSDLPLPPGLTSLEGWKVVLQSKNAPHLMPPKVYVYPPTLSPGDWVTAQVVDGENGKVVAETL